MREHVAGPVEVRLDRVPEARRLVDPPRSRDDHECDRRDADEPEREPAPEHERGRTEGDRDDRGRLPGQRRRTDEAADSDGRAHREPGVGRAHEDENGARHEHGEEQLGMEDDRLAQNDRQRRDECGGEAATPRRRARAARSPR